MRGAIGSRSSHLSTSMSPKRIKPSAPASALGRLALNMPPTTRSQTRDQDRQLANLMSQAGAGPSRLSMAPSSSSSRHGPDSQSRQASHQPPAADSDEEESSTDEEQGNGAARQARMQQLRRMIFNLYSVFSPEHWIGSELMTGFEEPFTRQT